MIIIHGINVPVGTREEEIVSLALRRAGMKQADAYIHKISLDARKRNDIKLSASVCIRADAAAEKRLAGRADCIYTDDVPYAPVIRGSEKAEGRIVVAGFGPAGMFAALTLAQMGYRPLVLERGSSMDRRIQSVESYRSGGELDEECNVQFGEGGAGTFSDGKLTTRIKDPICRYVSLVLAEHGAPKQILTLAKPHIGTDRLTGVVRSIRERIIALGGEVRFDTKLDGIGTKDGRLVSVSAAGEDIPCRALIAAIGHSARDTFEMLLGAGIDMSAKAFAVGARIEHTQESVNRSLYGDIYDPLLPVGEYQLSFTKGRGVYTFCMCPGGTVMASASGRGEIVTNGMSTYARDGKNANSAVIVSVSPADFGTHPLDGIRFAHDIERRAYEMGEGYAPASTVSAFLEDRASLAGCTVTPTYLPGVRECVLSDVLPHIVTDKMKEGLGVFARRMKCFGDGGAVLTAPETRTSSPVRITRAEDMQSNIKGVFPCGEGAGYAGGIMSAAVDGIRQAQAVMDTYRP